MTCQNCNDTGQILHTSDPPEWIYDLVEGWHWREPFYIPCTECGVYEADMAECRRRLREYFTEKAAENGETYDEYCERRFPKRLDQTEK